MNRIQVLSIWSVVLLALGLAGGECVATVQEPEFLTGEVWQAMSADAKVAKLAKITWLIAAFGERHLTGLGAAVNALTSCCFLSASLLTMYTHVLCKSLKRYDISGESSEWMVEHRR
jgi:hypothetical protein